MKRVVTIAAALAIGTIGIVGCKKNDTASDTNTNTTDNRTAGQKAGDAVASGVDKTTDAAKSAADKVKAATQPSADAAIKSTRDVLATYSEDAVTKGDLNNVVDQFNKAARDRLGKFDKASFADLDAAIDTFRNDWKAKYNQDFKLSDKEQLVFGTPVEIKVGDATDAARLASEKTGPEATAADQKAVNNVTTVNFPATAGAPALTLRVQNEGSLTNSYKIVVPDTLDGTKLKQNLIAHINAVEQAKDKWPSDVNEAYRIVSQHLLAASQDVK